MNRFCHANKSNSYTKTRRVMKKLSTLSKISVFYRQIFCSRVILMIFSISTFVHTQQVAFPGAEGFGAFATGGRGGTVYEVTNLNDSGPGSLRAVVETEGPRIVVFRVGGTIELQESLKIDDPYITIAGQSAPGDGITLKGYELRIRTHDVIVRYLRIRSGPSAAQDSVQLLGAERVILDHNSFSWATDENASATQGSKDVTFQWNIFS